MRCDSTHPSAHIVNETRALENLNRESRGAMTAAIFGFQSPRDRR